MEAPGDEGDGGGSYVYAGCKDLSGSSGNYLRNSPHYSYIAGSPGSEEQGKKQGKEVPPPPLFFAGGGRWGPAHKNFRKRGGGPLRIRAPGGYPHPFMRSPHPPSLVPEGWAPLPRPSDTPRETHLLGLEAWGVVPCFVQNRGGGGPFYKMENREEGGYENSGGDSPSPDLLGRGGGSDAEK